MHNRGAERAASGRKLTHRGKSKGFLQVPYCDAIRRKEAHTVSGVRLWENGAGEETRNPWTLLTTTGGGTKTKGKKMERTHKCAQLRPLTLRRFPADVRDYRETFGDEEAALFLDCAKFAQVATGVHRDDASPAVPQFSLVYRMARLLSPQAREKLQTEFASLLRKGVRRAK